MTPPPHPSAKRAAFYIFVIKLIVKKQHTVGTRKKSNSVRKLYMLLYFLPRTVLILNFFYLNSSVTLFQSLLQHIIYCRFKLQLQHLFFFFKFYHFLHLESCNLLQSFIRSLYGVHWEAFKHKFYKMCQDVHCTAPNL